jgi:hypothetical protein
MNLEKHKLETNYTNYIDELGNEIADKLNLDEKNRKILKDILTNINWDKHFKRRCKETLKNGIPCPSPIDPGSDYCRRHLNIKILKEQREK